ncbi:accessory factor UbiK family protein [Gilvimarinus algae]|uniref:Ubiquinone biosynthesis accessory factor UbiK n=1 Tax=Gilvimarinus algae TaxID=3058037 RepID=A0ABT8TGL2_9GAMM|nr:accessory factor UbiK family protein [Gilvimarinus sp. SDUM040014]MDO3383046.1 accessory factor UbiK family protein [Gilvimarinus sp. SDUM040014]
MQNFAQQVFDELRQRLPNAEALPRPQLQAALQAALRKLDLVTREEFDAQAAVLARTRARLEALEARVTELETRRN